MCVVGKKQKRTLKYYSYHRKSHFPQNLLYSTSLFIVLVHFYIYIYICILLPIWMMYPHPFNDLRTQFVIVQRSPFERFNELQYFILLNFSFLLQFFSCVHAIPQQKRFKRLDKRNFNAMNYIFFYLHYIPNVFKVIHFLKLKSLFFNYHYTMFYIRKLLN